MGIAPPSIFGRDDVLWFDQTAAIRKHQDIPRLVTNVLVDMTALRRLVGEAKRGSLKRRFDKAETETTKITEARRLSIPNKPGGGGEKMVAAVKAMVGAVQDRRVTYKDLRTMKQKNLSDFYPDAGRTLLTDARETALQELAAAGLSDKVPTDPTNDK